MRTRMLAVLVVTTLAVVGSSPARAGSYKPLEWETATKDGVTLEKPVGWEWKVKHRGHTVHLWSGSYKTSPYVIIHHAQFAENATATTIAEDYLENNGFEKPTVGEAIKNERYAALFAYDSWKYDGTRIVVRVELDPETRIGTVLFLRCTMKFFDSNDGWNLLDRIYVSKGKGAVDVPSHRTWRWRVQEVGGVGVRLPLGWKGEWRENADGGFLLIAYDGETLETSTYKIAVRKGRRTEKDADPVDTEVSIVTRIFSNTRLLNPRFATHDPNIYSDGDEHLAAFSKASGGYVITSLAMAPPSEFWAAEIPQLIRQLEGNIGIAPRELWGAWYGGDVRGIMDHYAGGDWVGTSSEQNGLMIAFYTDGTYEHRYFYSNNYMISNQVYSEESGRYFFDGYNLELAPTRRAIAYKENSDEITRREVYKAKELGTVKLWVERELGFANEIKVTGPSFRYAGMPPRFQAYESSLSGYTLERAPLDDVGAKVGFRKSDGAKRDGKAKQRKGAQKRGKATKSSGFKKRGTAQ